MFMLKVFIPSFEEGLPRRSKNITLPPVIGAAGEVSCRERRTSPGRADFFSVALHY